MIAAVEDEVAALAAELEVGPPETLSGLRRLETRLLARLAELEACDRAQFLAEGVLSADPDFFCGESRARDMLRTAAEKTALLRGRLLGLLGPVRAAEGEALRREGRPEESLAAWESALRLSMEPPVSADDGERSPKTVVGASDDDRGQAG